MIHFTYIQNSCGRSGHQLGDIISVFILSFLIGGEVVYDGTWKTKK